MALEDVLAQKWQADKQKDVLESLREYNESRAAWLQCEDSLCVDAAKEIATLRGKLRILAAFVIYGCTCRWSRMSRKCRRCVWLEERGGTRR